MSSGRLGGRAPKVGKPTPGPPSRSRGPASSPEAQAFPDNVAPQPRADFDDSQDALKTLQRLRDDLQEACTAYQIIRDGGRQGAMLAVSAATNFLADFGVPSLLREPLVSLAVALQAVEAGTSHPMFEANRRAGRAHQHIAELYAKAQAAAAMHLLMKSKGLRGPIAAAKVAEHVRRWRLKLSLKRNTLNAGTIIGWREQFSRDRDSPGGQMYHRFLKIAEANVDDPDVLIDRLLRHRPMLSAPLSDQREDAIPDQTLF